MTAEVIERVEKMAENYPMNDLKFGDRHNEEKELDEGGYVQSVSSEKSDESEENSPPSTDDKIEHD